jgi:hypothetical protein
MAKGAAGGGAAPSAERAGAAPIAKAAPMEMSPRLTPASGDAAGARSLVHGEGFPKA